MSNVEENSLVVALAGDCLIQHRTSAYREPRFLQLVELLRRADASITNFEGVIPRRRDWPAFVAGQGGFGSPYMAVPSWAVEELKWYGFDLVFTANNHASDFAEGGILSTIRHLDRGGMCHSGSGRNLTEATAPTYVYSPRGRIAVVNAADNGIRSRGEIPFPLPRGCLAADEGPSFADRPGLNMIRYEPIYHVDAATIQALKTASKGLGWEEDKALRRLGGGLHSPSVGVSAVDRREDTDSLFHFNGSKYTIGEIFKFETVPFDEDLERNYRWIREARANADVVVVGMHQQGASWDEAKAPDHTRKFAHGAIEAGADIFVAHGHGRFGGVEVFKGGVIIYGLPSFIMQLMERTRVPQEQLERCGLSSDATPSEFMEFMRRSMQIGLYPEGFGHANPSAGEAIFSVEFARSGGISRVLVHPLEATSDGRIGGRPILAEPGSAVHGSVLELAASRTKEHGTELKVINGVGIIEVA